jgi:membrane dipeptidase
MGTRAQPIADPCVGAAARLHAESLVCITHDHRPIGPDLPLMLAGGVTSKVFQVTLDVDISVGVNASRNRSELWRQQAEEALRQTLTEIDALSPRCRLARCAEDVERAKRDGTIAILLGTEGTRWLAGSLEPLHSFYERGLRELQLRWAFANEIVPADGRLSEFGRRVVQECNRLGIIVDLTHLPRAAFDDVFDAADGPLIVSHGSAKGVTVDLDDDQLRALAKTRGLVGIHFYTTYLGPSPSPDDVVRQVRYIADLVGIDHVALGVDFFPTDGAWRRMQEEQGAYDLRWAIEDMSQMPRITEALVRAGFSDDDVRKVLGLNFLRVLHEVAQARSA